MATTARSSYCCAYSRERRKRLGYQALRMELLRAGKAVIIEHRDGTFEEGIIVERRGNSIVVNIDKD